MSRERQLLRSYRYPFRPVFASLLQNRLRVLCICGIVLLYLIFSFWGYQVWFCPIYTAFGIRCPGCGLTHAIQEIAHGHWKAGFHQHAFAPIFMAGFVLVTIVSLLPESRHKKCVAWIAGFERRSGFFFFIMFALVMYWVIRTGIELLKYINS